MTSLLFLCSAAFLASCGAPLPTDVGPGPAVQAATVPTTAREGCAQVEITLSGRGGVSTRFPAREACDGGLVVVPGGEPRYMRGGGGILELPMAVSNGTGAEVALPARLLLLPDSAVVLFPSGLQGRPNQQIVARGADGTVPEGEPWTGAWRWDMGEPGTLGAGAQSAPRTLAFTVPNGVQRFRLAFGVEAEQAALDTIWPVVTGSGPMLDTTVVIPLSDDPNGTTYFRTAIIITFEAGVSSAAKAAFFARHSIAVLGVDPATSPLYYVQIPDPGMDVQAFYAVIDELQAEAETRSVLPIVFRGMRYIGLARYPDDGGAPVRVGVFEWKHQPAHPDFARSTPLHRESSDDSIRIANSRPMHPDSVAAMEKHAAGVTGLVSAQGDNASGIAGMMWRSRLYLYSGFSAAGGMRCARRW